MPLDPSKPVQRSVGRYDILEMIAEGGMGTVYKGVNRESGEIVAIKIVPPTAAKNPTLLKRFEREFTAARALDHPNVVKAIEFDASGPTPFLVMEYVDGESLGQRIEREGKLPIDESIRIISEVAQGLYRAHKQGLIHRDVKPDNILLNSEGKAKLTDLGLVKEVDDDFNLTKTGRGLGTPHFMAPEQFRDAKNADVRCDIYSLGATLYMMVTGEMPFGKTSALDCYLKKFRNELTPPRQLNPEISERIDWAIRRAMSGNPDQRPSSCREFVEDLFGRSTRPVTAPSGESSTATQDLWYLVYHDETGEAHTVKGGVEGIRKALSEGLLGDAGNIVAGRQKNGPFLPLRNYPEFRDLIVAPAPGQAPGAAAAAGPPGQLQSTTAPTAVNRLGARSTKSIRSTTTGSPASGAPADSDSPVSPLVARQARQDLLLWILVVALSIAAVFGVRYFLS